MKLERTKLGPDPHRRFLRLLVPVDFTAASLEALRYAGVVAERFGSTIHLLHVVETHPFAMSEGAVLYLKSDEAAAREATEVALRSTVGSMTIDQVMIEERAKVQDDPRLFIQRLMDGYESGLVMKTNKNKSKNNGLPQRVHFEFASPSAASVAIAGSFNDWKPNATRMIALGQGRWAKDLALPPGEYEYCLVVDGQWMPDPLTKQTVPNPLGGVNSVLKTNGCAS
jgi:hypothetical protein